ncbi:hypothetical protein Holit_00965 [Hollandina sp. SP2]
MAPADLSALVPFVEKAQIWHGGSLPGLMMYLSAMNV